MTGVGDDGRLYSCLLAIFVCTNNDAMLHLPLWRGFVRDRRRHWVEGAIVGRVQGVWKVYVTPLIKWPRK